MRECCGGPTHEFNVWLAEETLADINERVEEVAGIEVWQQWIKQLKDGTMMEGKAMTLEDFGVLNLDTLVLLPPDFCLGGAYFAGTMWPCDDKDPDHNWGPPTWAAQNRGRGKREVRFDRCRGFDGANANFKSSVTGDYICVEADKDGGGNGGGSDECSGLVTYQQAKAHCEGMHSRLCTQEELQMSCAERKCFRLSLAFKLQLPLTHARLSQARGATTTTRGSGRTNPASQTRASGRGSLGTS